MIVEFVTKPLVPCPQNRGSRTEKPTTDGFWHEVHAQTAYPTPAWAHPPGDFPPECPHRPTWTNIPKMLFSLILAYFSIFKFIKLRKKTHLFCSKNI